MFAPACSANADFGAESSLDIARRAFDALVRGPHPVSLNGRDVPGLPPRPMRMDQVRELVVHRRCPQALRDRIWWHLAMRSRSEGGTWTVACTGVALPALITIATRFSARNRLDTVDLHAAVLTGFLSGLAEIGLERPGIMNRLRWAAYRSGHAALHEALDAPRPDPAVDVSKATKRQHAPRNEGHPDLVLARAVADGVLAPHEADLIATTRIDGHRLTRVAADRGVSYEALKKTRARAERRLAGHLAGPCSRPYEPPSAARERSSIATGAATATASAGPLPGWSR